MTIPALDPATIAVRCVAWYLELFPASAATSVKFAWRLEGDALGVVLTAAQ